LLLKTSDNSEFYQFPVKNISMIVYEDVTVTRFVVGDDL